MASPIKVEHAWGQTPAYSERVVHALPEKCRVLAFKAQRFLDQAAPWIISLALGGSGVSAVYFSGKRWKIFLPAMLGMTLGSYFIGNFPALLTAKSDQFSRGSKADVALVAVATLAISISRIPSAILVSTALLLYSLVKAAEKHRNALLVSFDKIWSAFDILGHAAIVRELTQFKLSNPGASPNTILTALIASLKRLPDTYDSGLLDPIFKELEQHLKFIPEEEKCSLGGHVFLKERLRFTSRTLYDLPQISLDHPFLVALTPSAKEKCIQWLKNPRSFPEFSSLQQAIEVSRLANYAGAAPLEDFCATFIISQIRSHNFLEVLESSRSYSLLTLFERLMVHLVIHKDRLLPPHKLQDKPSEFRTRLTELAQQHSLGCVSYLLNPADYPRFNFTVCYNRLTLELNKEMSFSHSYPRTPLVVTPSLLNQAQKLLKNTTLNGSLDVCLFMENCELSDEILSELYNTRVKELHLSYCKKPKDAEPKEWPKANETLCSLTLQFGREQSLSSFIPTSQNLQELKLECSQIQTTVNISTLLEKNPALKAIDLHSCSVTAEGTFLEMSRSLRTLFFTSCYLTLEAFTALCQELEKNKPLNELVLGDCGINDQKMEVLRRLLVAHPILHILRLINFHKDVRQQNDLTVQSREELVQAAKEKGKVAVIQRRDGTYVERVLRPVAARILPSSKPLSVNLINRIAFILETVILAGSAYKLIVKPASWKWNWTVGASLWLATYMTSKSYEKAVAHEQKLVSLFPPPGTQYYHWQEAEMHFERVHQHVPHSRFGWHLLLESHAQSVRDLKKACLLEHIWMTHRLKAESEFCQAVYLYIELVRSAMVS